MFRWKKTITDDAGAEVDAHDLSSPTDERPGDEDSLTALNALLMHEVYASTRGNLSGPQLIFILAGLTGLAVSILMRTYFPASPIYMAYVAAGMVASAQIVIGLRLQAARAAATIVATMLAHGRCGSCGYSLREITPDAHGRAVCPECGAAWNHSRLGTARAGVGAVGGVGGVGGAGGSNWASRANPARGELLAPPTLIDDAQRVVLLMDSRTTGQMQAQTHAAVWDAVRRAVRRDRILSLLLLALFTPITAGLLLFDFWNKLIGPLTFTNGLRALGGFVGIWAVLFFGIVYFIKGLRTHYERYAPAIRGAFLAHGHCPACSAALTPQEQEPQPTACPGCGARWKQL